MYLISVIPYLCILIAWLLAMWPRFLASKEMKAMPGGYDNSDPRGQQTKLDGRSYRAVCAHQNGLENLAVFGLAVLAAMQRAVDVVLVALLAVLYVVIRWCFVRFYLADRPSARSTCFGLGALICLILFVCAAFGWPKF
ncbi:MAG TPA: MAPEG family protein [Stellaceae bacterium]|nr:MAPEG family protein [Stellaceae bacterium]